MKTKLVSLRELSQILGKSESSIRYHVRMKRILPHGKLGRNYCFDINEVMKQIRKNGR